MIDQKRIAYLIFTVILFFIGFTLAPPSMADGEYQVEITFQRENVRLSAFFNTSIDSSISSPSTLRLINSSSDELPEYIIFISYYERYSGKINSELSFMVNITKNGELVKDVKFHEVVGRIRGSNFDMSISPTRLSEGSILFQFRILKQSNIALGLLLMVSFLWLTEVVPLAASSLLIPIILVVYKIDGASGALSQFFHPIIALFLAGFLMAEAMKRTKLDRYISLQILAHVPANAQLLAFVLMAVTATFSMFMSNTAAAAVFIPLAITLVDNLESEAADYKKTVVLGIAYAATIGGIGSLIGTPPNIIAAEFVKDFTGTDISFLEWFFFGLPVVAAMIPIIFGYLWYRYRPKVDKKDLKIAKNHCIETLKREHHLTLDQVVVGMVFMIVFVLWLTTEIHGISAAIIAVLGAVILFFTGHIKEEDLKRINWNALITFGGGLTLGLTVLRTGLADWIAFQLGMLREMHPFVTLLVLGIIALLLTAIASNTASASILIPIVMPLGLVLGIDPILVAILVAIVCSVDFAIVIGTPPTMLAYSTGLYKVKEIFRTGIILDLIGLLVVTMLAWFLFGQVVVLVMG